MRHSLIFLLLVVFIFPLIAHENKLSTKSDHAKNDSINHTGSVVVVHRSRLSAHVEEGPVKTTDSAAHSTTISPTKLSSHSSANH